MAQRRPKKPVRYDPTRTGLLRKRFENEVHSRFNRLNREIGSFLLRPEKVTVNALWPFTSAIDAFDRFQKWLRDRVDVLILGESGTKDEAGNWTDDYVQTAFFRGADQAARALGNTAPNPATPSAIRAMLQSPVNLNKVRLLKERAYETLKDISKDISLRLGDILSDSLVAGTSPREAAKAISKELETIKKTRALTLARTETIRAHAEGSLESMKQLGVQTVGVDVEWQATMIDEDKGIFEEKVCPQCQALAGMVIPIEEAHGLIPRHPNCRCAFVPNVLGKTSKKELRERIARSILRGKSKKDLESKKALDLVKEDRWQGSTLLFKSNE
jgi:SPP1 gp7 family putative phage head morphogenesis protein